MCRFPKPVCIDTANLLILKYYSLAIVSTPALFRWWTLRVTRRYQRRLLLHLKMNLSSNGPSMLPLNASVFPDFLVIRPVNTLIQKAGAAP